MSTKSRKAIPLKEDIVQPTSFDLEKLSETMAAFATQLKNASVHFSEQGMEYDNKASDMYNISERLDEAMSSLSEVTKHLNNYLD